MAENSSKILENEKEIFQKLFDLNKKIYKLYQELINKPDNYEKTIDYLTICLEIEENLYNQLNYDRIDIYLNYLNINFLKKISDYDITLSDFYEFSLKKRIYTRLKYKNEERISALLEDDNKFQNGITLTKILDEDFKRLYIFFLNELEKKNPKFKKKLEKAKYLMYFLNPILEKELIINQDKTFITSYSAADMLDIDDDTTNKLINTYITHYLKKYIELLLNINDYKYKDKDIYFKTLLYEALISSCFEMTDNFDIWNNKYPNYNSKSMEIIRKIQENRNSYDIIKLRTERFNKV